MTRELTAGTPLQLCVASRWDALELMDALLPYYPYLIERGPSRWEIHARARGDLGECMPDLHERVTAVLRRRGLDGVEISCGGDITVIVRRPKDGRGGSARPKLDVHRHLTPP